MNRRGSGFGFVILVVVLAVVLVLAARAWKTTMPVAAGALKPAQASEDAPPAATSSPRTVYADLRKIQRQADRRAEDYQDALQVSE